MSDGQDNGSKEADFGDLKKLSKEEETLLYWLYIRPPNLPESMHSLQANDFIQILTENTGGHGFFPSTSDKTKGAFEMLAAELSNQYRIGFEPAESPTKRRWREIKVKLSKKAQGKFGKVLVIARKGFYF